MFCQECGSKNNDSAAFCANCGTKLKQQKEPIKVEQPYVRTEQEEPQGDKNKKKKGNIILLGELAVLCFLIIFIHDYGKKQYDTESIAQQYFIQYMNADWKAVYKNMDLIESNFLTEKNFIKAMEKQEGKEIRNFYITDTKKSNGRNLCVITISYQEKASDVEQSFTISLIKQPQKKYGIFDCWKVDSYELLVNEYLITVPKGVMVTLDGVSLDKSYLAETDEKVDYYTLPVLFRGRHEIKLEQENMEELVRNFDTSEEILIPAMEFEKKIKKEITQQLRKDMKMIYTVAINGEAFKKVKNFYAKNYTDNGKKNLEELIYYMHSTGDTDGLKQVDFYNLSANIVGDGKCAEIRLSYDYDAIYTILDWWTGTSSMNTYTDNEELYLQMIEEDGEWKLKSVYFEPITY
ncbi:MAG: zinc ribbon domain-containing protein [Acetivibrio sp.]